MIGRGYSPAYYSIFSYVYYYFDIFIRYLIINNFVCCPMHTAASFNRRIIMNNKIERWITNNEAVRYNDLLNAVYTTAKHNNELDFTFFRHELAISSGLQKRIDANTTFGSDEEPYADIYYYITRRKPEKIMADTPFIDTLYFKRAVIRKSVKRRHRDRNYREIIKNDKIKNTGMVYRLLTTKYFSINEYFKLYKELYKFFKFSYNYACTLMYFNIPGRFFINGKEYENIELQIHSWDSMVKATQNTALTNHVYVEHKEGNEFAIRFERIEYLCANNYKPFEAVSNNWYYFNDKN